MELFLLRIFQRQVLLQCQFVMQAEEQIERGLKKRDNTILFCGVQNLLTAAANISKALWGIRGKHSEARKPLRDSIGITETSPLKDVTLRNHYEHFDERIDRWWNESLDHNFADMCYGKPGPKGYLGLFRQYDHESRTLGFWGDVFDVGALIAEINRILPTVRKQAEMPHWEVPDDAKWMYEDD